jgi:transcriptional regulator with XRE-family HTH domain
MDMTITETAGSVRRARGISQSLIASRTGEATSNLSVIENGRRTPSAEKLDRILRAADARLAAIPTTRAGVLEASTEIRRSLSQWDERAAFRRWLAYNDALAAENPVNRVVLAAFPPEATGSALYDAALAAITEYRLLEVLAPIPDWVDEAEPLAKPTVFADSPYVKTINPSEVAEPFRRRGVLIPEATLRSV